VACVPPSGSVFPTGTTTVTCTATDAQGLTDTCSFSVTVFGACLKNDSNPGNAVLFNPGTGEYMFCCNGVLIASGTGTPSKVGCTVTIQHNVADRRVKITADVSLQKGTATIQKPVGTVRCSITDKNLSSAACMCQ
ncbi:MAG: HYR domain-containing protein, partial [Acidobacteriota bacterium]